MAQTPTTLEPATVNRLDELKLGVLKVVNDNNETSIVIDWSVYGITTVIAYGMIPLVAYTADDLFCSLSGYSVTYDWGAADMTSIEVWAIGT